MEQSKYKYIKIISTIIDFGIFDKVHLIYATSK